MQTFLNQVANHYASSTLPFNELVFVTPNRRSALHLRKELRDAAGGERAKGLRIVSINDFFQTVHCGQTTDRIRLLLALYDCYRGLNPDAESLDDFLHWGSMMISDFDNVDKYLVDASKIFCNVADFKAIQDTYEYLTDEQRKAIQHFVSHFWDRSGRLTVNMSADSKDVKSRFLKVWNLLGPLYETYKVYLADKDMAYEGMIYRAVAESIKGGCDVSKILEIGFKGRKKFIFVGLNALNECEKIILRSVRDANKAEFVWDFSSKEIRDKRNRASFFLSRNINEFPQAFPLDTAGLSRPKVRVIAVPSSVGQMKLAPQVLSQASGRPEDTAFVLPDENLLMPLLSAIPEEYDTVNVTMGYPMDKSAVYTLLKTIAHMNLTAKTKDDVYYYYYKSVENIFSSGLFRSAIQSDEDRALVDNIKHEARQYIPVDELLQSDTLKEFFYPLTRLDNVGDVVDPTIASVEQNRSICTGLMRIVARLEALCSSIDNDTMQVEAEFCRRYGKALETLRDTDLPVLPSTWLRILDGLLKGESVPFEGSALQGLQVMGTLETRALDFRNVCIMSVNEDLFPHRSVDSSFIPSELRKGFGMPTLEYQDAVWAYYFYRLIQRAENVWLIYDSRKEGLLSGEESRYIKQLRYHFRYDLDEYTAVAPLAPVAEDEAIEKTQGDIDALKSHHLSASSLQSYLACPAKFYYQAVKRLDTEDEVAESLDASMVGTIFHGVMQKLYSGTKLVSADDLSRMIADEFALRSLIREGILDQMKTIEVSGRNLVVEEVILEYVKAALKHDLGLLRRSGSAGFKILGLERYVKTTIEGFPFIGFIDRIDSYQDGQIRVVDYKTGRVEDEDININDGNAKAVADKLFGESNFGRPKIALQMYLYGKFAHEEILRPGETLVNSIYATSGLMTKPLEDVVESPAFIEDMDGRIKVLLSEIADTSVLFRRTTDKNTCAMCDFRSICGR